MTTQDESDAARIMNAVITVAALTSVMSENAMVMATTELRRAADNHPGSRESILTLVRHIESTHALSRNAAAAG